MLCYYWHLYFVVNFLGLVIGLALFCLCCAEDALHFKTYKTDSANKTILTEIPTDIPNDVQVVIIRDSQIRILPKISVLIKYPK